MHTQHSKSPLLLQQSNRFVCTEQHVAIEAALGSDHLDVAASLVDIAGQYYERQDYAKAQLLFERGLGIYEKAYGPDHVDLAPCLMTLGICHLEQVRRSKSWQAAWSTLQAHL